MNIDMLNRKENKPANGPEHPRAIGSKTHLQRRRFIISPRAHGQLQAAPTPPANGLAKPQFSSQAKTAYANSHGTPTPGRPSQAVDLTETIKTLLHLAHENGHVTYDDINDILPDGLSPDDLDQLYTKLRNLDVEIVDHAEA